MLCLASLESRIPKPHPLRPIKRMADEALRQLGPVFDRMFCEQLEFDLLFRWFLDMDMVEHGFDASTFSRNRERLLEHDVSGRFFQAVLDQARRAGLLSSEHFSVDGTLIEAWASIKSFRPKDEDGGDHNGWGDFNGQKRSNETHESKTDPEAKLMRKGKGQEAKLSFSGHALMDNRNGLVVDLRIAEANGFAEREVALQRVGRAKPVGKRVTLGADRAYDTRGFVAGCHQRGVVPHVAQNQHERRRSAIDRRTTRHPGYQMSQRVRMRVEQIFGWMKSIGGLRRTRFRGKRRTQLAATIVAVAYNLLRLSSLMTAIA